MGRKRREGGRGGSGRGVEGRGKAMLGEVRKAGFKLRRRGRREGWKSW